MNAWLIGGTMAVLAGVGGIAWLSVRVVLRRMRESAEAASVAATERAAEQVEAAAEAAAQQTALLVRASQQAQAESEACEQRRRRLAAAALVRCHRHVAALPLLVVGAFRWLKGRPAAAAVTVGGIAVASAAALGAMAGISANSGISSNSRITESGGPLPYIDGPAHAEGADMVEDTKGHGRKPVEVDLVGAEAGGDAPGGETPGSTSEPDRDRSDDRGSGSSSAGPAVDEPGHSHGTGTTGHGNLSQDEAQDGQPSDRAAREDPANGDMATTAPTTAPTTPSATAPGPTTTTTTTTTAPAPDPGDPPDDCIITIGLDELLDLCL